MKHLTMAEKSLLLDDASADLLVEYAALIARVASGDHIRVNALSTQGEAVVVDVLLNSGTVLLVETTRSVFPEPDNGGALAEMHRRMASYEPSAQPQGESPFGVEG